MIKLNQWIYDRGYRTELMGVNHNEISSVCEINDPYRNHSGSVVTTKNGKSYEVKEDVRDILSMWEMMIDREEP